MKCLILAVICFCITCATIRYLNRHSTGPISRAEPAAEVVPNRATEDTQSANAALQETEPTPPATATNPIQVPLASPVLKEARPDNPASSTDSTPFRRAMDVLVSRQASFQERQAAWKKLRDAGELDQALATLKQDATNNPTSAEYSIALGEAYVYKLQTIRDFHQVAILALQADQSFDTALGIDPANWEAQFFKAATLSRWPAEMNKGPEVIQQLSNLIDQQEAMPSQPQFAQTYVLLG